MILLNGCGGSEAGSDSTPKVVVLVVLLVVLSGQAVGTIEGFFIMPMLVTWLGLALEEAFEVKAVEAPGLTLLLLVLLVVEA